MAKFVCAGCENVFEARYNKQIPFQLIIGHDVPGRMPGKKYFCQELCVHEFTRNQAIGKSAVVKVEDEYRKEE